MADNNTVARPYAEAAFEVAKENDALDDLSRSLAAGKDMLADGALLAGGVLRFPAEASLVTPVPLWMPARSWVRTRCLPALTSTARTS